MSVSPAPAQGQQACEIRVQDSGRVNNASTSSADLSAVASDSSLILGRKVFFDDTTTTTLYGSPSRAFLQSSRSLLD